MNRALNRGFWVDQGSARGTFPGNLPFAGLFNAVALAGAASSPALRLSLTLKILEAPVRNYLRCYREKPDGLEIRKRSAIRLAGCGKRPLYRAAATHARMTTRPNAPLFSLYP